MELIAVKDESRYSILFDPVPVKYLGYGFSHVIFVTVNNEIYELDTNDNEFIKLENLPFKIVKYLVCVGGCSIVVNEKNEIFTKGDFGKRNDKIFTLLENISLKENITKIRVGENYFLNLTNNNSLFGYGENGCGQLGIEEETNKKEELIKINHNLQISDIRCSSNHSMILDNFGSVYTTGQNYYGQLGLGDNCNKFKFTKVELPFKVIKIYADNLISFVINENNELYVAGYNQEGELGIGNSSNINIFQKIIIDNFNPIYYGFNFSYVTSSFISDGNNNIFISGGAYGIGLEKYGIPVISNDYFLTTFKEVNIPLNKKKFVYVIPLSTLTIIVLSNYGINCENEKKSFSLGLKIFQKVSQQQLVDLKVICCDCEYYKY